MMWVEILSRHRDVAARFRVSGDEARIGRGYDNDVVVDDPCVAASHVRIFRDEAGRLVAEDAGSKNGLFLDRDTARQKRIVVDPERPIRIGHTCLRIREATHAVPPERPAGAPAQPFLAAAAGGLAASVLGLEALFMWLAQTSEPKASIYVNGLLIIAVLALVWVSVWTILSRIFSGQARFVQNFVIGLSGLLLIALYRELSEIAAFALTWPAAISNEYVAQSVIVAVACFFHLRETGRSRLVLKGAVMAALLVLAVALQALLRSESAADYGQQPTVRLMMPPAFRLAPVRNEGDYFADVERLKAGLDRDRTRTR